MTDEKSVEYGQIRHSRESGNPASLLGGPTPLGPRFRGDDEWQFTPRIRRVTEEVLVRG
jgi:hypothetical protein